MRPRFKAVLAIFLSLLIFAFLGAMGSWRALAHPLSQGRLAILASPEKVSIQAKVNFEQVCITNALRVDQDDRYRNFAEPCRKHGEYLLKHLYLSADGKPLAGRATRVAPPSAESIHGLDAQAESVGYEFEFPVEKPPAKIELKEDVLREVEYTPGNYYDTSFVVSVERNGKLEAQGLLLTSSHPLEFSFDWAPLSGGAGVPPATVAGGTPAPPGEIDKWRMTREYLVHGIMHILTGYDHLLFISALVLGAAGVWDLVKVVTAFTLAHTLTLTLSVLDVVRLPEKVVEPMIAASIVFVALENVFFPKRSRGWGRLAAAFFFGLFHGLGFAGGLLQAMQGMPGVAVAVAIIAFSLGVETGHQMIVLPLFGALTLARRSQKEQSARDRISLAAQRFGSAIISIAGLFFLYAALFQQP